MRRRFCKRVCKRRLVDDPERPLLSDRSADRTRLSARGVQAALLDRDCEIVGERLGERSGAPPISARPSSVSAIVD